MRTQHSLIKELATVIFRMPSKPYLAYIRSPQWAKTRTAHLERIDHICEICRWRRAMQVHHWTYARLGFELPQDLCGVCVTCHHKLHCSIFEPAANDNFQFSLPLEESG